MLEKAREGKFPTDIFEGSRAELKATEYAEHLQEVMPVVWKAAIASRMEAIERSADFYNLRASSGTIRGLNRRTRGQLRQTDPPTTPPFLEFADSSKLS